MLQALALTLALLPGISEPPNLPASPVVYSAPMAGGALNLHASGEVSHVTVVAGKFVVSAINASHRVRSHWIDKNGVHREFVTVIPAGTPTADIIRKMEAHDKIVDAMLRMWPRATGS